MDYQGNTRKSKEKPEKPDQLEAIVTGPVIKREKGTWLKFKGIFFGGDFRTSAVHVVGDVFWPTLRQMAFDIVTEGAKGVLFGESGYRRRQPTNYGSRYRYDTPNALPRPDPRYSGPISRLPDQRPTYRAPQREMSQIILYSRSEAENVLERLTDIIDKYEVVSLADLYQLLNLEVNPIDNKWGWTYLHNTEIRQVRDGFLLDLPPIEVI